MSKFKYYILAVIFIALLICIYQKKGRGKRIPEKKNNQQQEYIILNNPTKHRIAQICAVGDIVTLKYSTGINIYNEPTLKEITFKVPSGIKAKIIESVITVDPKLYKVEVVKGDDTYTGWVTAYVVY